MKKYFDENSKVSAITAILWLDVCTGLNEERINQIFSDCNCSYDWILSPLHNPDPEHNKPHRHFCILNREGHDLSYKKVDYILSCLYNLNGGKYNKPLCVYGGKKSIRENLRYYIHRSASSGAKEQFDIRNPLFTDFEVDDNGICQDNKLLSAYDEVNGVLCSSGFDYWDYIRLTARETASFEKEYDTSVMTGYVFQLIAERGLSFADVVDWSIQNGCFSAVMRFSHQIMQYCKDRKKFRKTDVSNLNEVDF